MRVNIVESLALVQKNCSLNAQGRHHVHDFVWCQSDAMALKVSYSSSQPSYDDSSKAIEQPKTTSDNIHNCSGIAGDAAHLHERLHATSPGAAAAAPLHSTELVQVLQQGPGLLNGMTQPLTPQVHFDP